MKTILNLMGTTIASRSILESVQKSRAQRFLAFCLLLLGASFQTVPAWAGLVTSGIVLDLEAGKGVTLDGSGGVISWTDQSGQGHNASQGSIGNRPTFVANGLSGGPTLRFNGAAQFLNLSGQVLTTQQFTIMALVTDNSTNSGLREIFSNWSSTTFTHSVFLGHTGLSPTHMRFSDSFDSVGNVVNPSMPSVLTGMSTSTDALVYQDGTLLAQKGTPLATRDLSDIYRIGTQGGGFEFWNGDIAAILVYNRALTNAELNQNVQFLQSPTVAVPEPSTITLSGVGLILLGAAAVRQRRKLEPRA